MDKAIYIMVIIFIAGSYSVGVSVRCILKIFYEDKYYKRIFASPYYIHLHYREQRPFWQYWNPCTWGKLKSADNVIMIIDLHSCTVHVDNIKSFICPNNAHKLL